MQSEPHDQDVALDERLEHVKARYTERFIRRADRNARAWRWTRWFAIAIGIAMLLSFTFLFHQSCQAFSDWWSVNTPANTESGLGPSVTALDLRLEISSMAGILTSWSGGIVGIVVGVWMVLYGAFGERRIQSDLLLAALLKERLGTSSD
ncbi:MAG: hypothetical protein ACYTFO_00760 [Planctomycetota bacterium]